MWKTKKKDNLRWLCGLQESAARFYVFLSLYDVIVNGHINGNGQTDREEHCTFHQYAGKSRFAHLPTQPFLPALRIHLQHLIHQDILGRRCPQLQSEDICARKQGKQPMYFSKVKPIRRKS